MLIGDWSSDVCSSDLPLQLGPVLEPALVLGGTVGGCLLLHELVIRRTSLLRPLFGLKRRRTEAEGAAAPTAQPLACPERPAQGIAVHREQLDGVAAAIVVGRQAKGDADECSGRPAVPAPRLECLQPPPTPGRDAH